MTTSQSQSQSADVGELIAALSKAQAAFPEIKRDRVVTVTPRNGGRSYTFRYATLSAIINSVRPALAANGLAYTQTLSYNRMEAVYYLETTLRHQNQFISSKVPLLLDEHSGNQQFGSALTYMRRYTLAAILGLAADEDDDGNIADGNEVSDAAPVKHPAPAPAPDPISTGTKRAKALEELAQIDADQMGFDPAKIDVPLLKDESGSDWMLWGRQFIAMARLAPDDKSLKEFEANNSIPLKNMEFSAPKMYANLSVSLIKVRKEKADAK